MLHSTSGEVSTLSRWPEGIVTPMQYQVLRAVSANGNTSGLQPEIESSILSRSTILVLIGLSFNG